MDLPEATLELLRDEAYVTLCREAVQGRLDSLEQEKVAIASTRPPFGVLARKETRDAFTHSMRTALDNETALRDRLAQIERLADWLQPIIRQELETYLAAASSDYQRFPYILALLDDWETSLQRFPDLLVAFARDMRALREATANTVAGHGQCAHELAVLRDVAVRLEDLQNQLLRIGVAIGDQANVLAAAEVKVPTLPDFRRIAWVSRLGVMPLDQVVAELARVESEVRAFLQGGNALVLARISANRELCTAQQERFLLYYWNQLRTHAQQHYVEERDIDDVLAMLTARYVEAVIVKKQKALTHDPFLVAR
jgi:hypothetical protein